MRDGHYWVKWSHIRLPEMFVVFVSTRDGITDCWVPGCEIPYGPESFTFIEECKEPCRTMIG